MILNKYKTLNNLYHYILYMFKFVINIAKFIPTIIIIASLSFGIMFFSLKGIVFGLLCICSTLINLFFKNYIFKPIYYSTGRSSLPILGQGERPHDHPKLDMLENYWSESISFGMPSGYSQTILFYATFWIIYILIEYKENKSNTDIIYKCCSIVYMIILIFIVIHNRYYFRYHTIEQIVIGGIFGIGLAFLAMFLCKSIFLTKYAKECEKEEDIEINDEEQEEQQDQSHTTQINNGQVQDHRLIAKNQHSSETERNMQRMSYDFHNDQINDYVNNFNETGAYNSPQFTKINKVGFNEDLSKNDNLRLQDNISFNSNMHYNPNVY